MSKRDQREGEGSPLPFTQSATHTQPGPVHTSGRSTVVAWGYSCLPKIS